MTVQAECRGTRGEAGKAIRPHALLLGTTAALALFLAAQPASANRIERRFPAETRPIVSVQNSYGKISVKSWDRPEVLIVAEHPSDKLEVDAEQMGGRIEINTHFLQKNLTPAEKKAEYEITVPEETELQIKNDEGTIVVEHVSGDMTFETVASDVQLQEVAGYILVKTVGGSLMCVRCAGRLEVESISGNLKFLQPVSNNVRARTYSGSIFFDGDFLAGGSYSLRTTTGAIEVRYTDSDSFDLRASSPQGRIDHDASLTLGPPSHMHGNPPTASLAGGRPKSNSWVTGVFNNGAARVDLSSFSGTISLRKRN